MKIPACCSTLLVLALSAASAQDSPLAKPLRKYDRNKDGKLTGEEVVLARQAFNRGGRALDGNLQRGQEMRERRKADWNQRQHTFLDTNKDGKIDEAEQKAGDAVWSEIATGDDNLREEILRKYDRNDDGELNGEERAASRAEWETRRTEIEKKIMDAHRSSTPTADPPTP